MASTHSTGLPPGSAEAPPRGRVPLVEVFASLQGEGRYTGRTTVFVRTATCPIRCRYCDTPGSYTAPGAVPVAGVGDEPNPVAPVRLLELVAAAAAGPLGDQAGSDGTVLPAMVSFTGGEPLVHGPLLGWCGAALRRDGRVVALETAALDPDALRHALPGIDHLSADWKLPSTLVDGADHSGAHRECIRIALAAGRTVDAKVVLTPSVTDREFDRFLHAAMELERGGDGAPEWILQPLTPFGAEDRPLPTERLASLVARSHGAGLPVRVQHQMHKVWQLP